MGAVFQLADETQIEQSDEKEQTLAMAHAVVAEAKVRVGDDFLEQWAHDLQEAKRKKEEELERQHEERERASMYMMDTRLHERKQQEEERKKEVSSAMYYGLFDDWVNEPEGTAKRHRIRSEMRNT